MEGDPDARLDLSDYTIPDESRGETMSDVECWRADAKWWKKEDDKHLREIKRLRIALHEIAQSERYGGGGGGEVMGIPGECTCNSCQRSKAAKGKLFQDQAKKIERLRELVKDGFYEGFDYGTGAGEPRWEQSKVCRALAEVGRD